MKRLIAVLLAMMLVLSMFPVTALAPSDVTSAAATAQTEPTSTTGGPSDDVSNSITTPGTTAPGTTTEDPNPEPPQSTPSPTQDVTTEPEAPAEPTVYHSVTFLVSGETYTITQVEDGSLCPEPPIPPIPEDMTSFAGWYTEDHNLFDFENTPVTGDISLHAVFKDTYLVKFLNADGKVIDSKEVRRGGTVSATAVEVVPPAGRVFEGWYLDGSPYDFSQPVNTNLSLTPHFRDLFYVYFDSQGSYVAPQLVDVGGRIQRPADPTRAGYAFSHWSLEPDGAAFNFSQPVQGDTTLYAVWAKESVQYTVVYWLEKANLPDSADLNNRENYQYAFTETRQAPAGDTVTLTQRTATASNSAVKYASFHHSPSTVISGNGTTVVNVYFTRDLYTIYFDLNAPSINVGSVRRPDYRSYTATMQTGGRTYTSGGARYSITAKYQQDIGDLWPVLTYDQGSPSIIAKLSGYGDLHFVGWNASGSNWTSKRLTLTADMMPSSGTSRTLYASWSEDTVVLYLQYMVESLEGSVPGAVRYNGKYYLPDPDYTQYAENGYITLFNQKKIDGMTAVGVKWEETDWWGSPVLHKDGSYHQYLFYDRQSLSISFDTQGGSAVKPVTGIKYGAGIQDKKPADPVKDGYKFLGWYTDAEYHDAFDFTGATMPSHNLKLFAKWESTQFTATFLDRAGGSVLGTQGKADGEYVSEPDYYEAGRFYEGLGEFLGWYWHLPGTTRPVAYSWETPVHSDVEIFAAWRTDGFTVTYDAGGADGRVPVDSDTYAMGVNARVLSADGLSLSNKVFVGWQKNGAGAVYYPGSLMPVEGDTVLAAKWVDPANVARLVYDANYGSPAETVTWMVERYDTVALAGDLFTRDGYDLIGWAENKQAEEPDYLPGDEFQVINNTEHLYAVWQRQTYSVTFAAGLHGSLRGEQNFTKIPGGTAWNEAVTVPTPVPNEGYYFAGWTPSFPDTVTGNLTFTANFEAQILVTVTGKSDTYTYDGEKHYAKDYEFTGVGAFTLTGLTAYAEGTLAGSYPVKVSGTPKVTDHSGRDITDHYRFVYEDGTLLIKPRNITLTANDAGKTYGDSDPEEFSVRVTGGLVPGDSLSYTASRIPGENVGTYDIIPSATPNANYKITVKSGTFTISQRDLTLTANSDTFTYDGTEKTVAGFTYSGLLDGQELSGLSASRTEKNAGTYKVEITGTPKIMEGKADVTENYNITLRDGSLIIEAASIPLSITGNSDTFTYDGQPKTVAGFTSTGLLDGHVLSGVSAEVTGTMGGTYPVKVTGTPKIMDGKTDVTGNYDITLVPGSMVIERKEISITAIDGGKTYGEEDPAELTVKIDGLVPGESIAYTVSREPGEDADSYAINVSASDTANYKVTAVPGTFTISPKDLSITANSDTFTYDGTEKTVSGFTSDGLLNGQEITGISASRTEKNAGTYKVEITGTPKIMEGKADVTENYNITLHDGSLVIDKASLPLSITGNSDTFTYDGQPKTVAGYTYSGLLDGHTLSGLSAEVTGTMGGTYPVKVTGTPKIMDGETDVTGNYDITFVPGSMVIEQKEISITAIDAGKTYGEEDPAELTVKIDGLVAGESIAYTVSREPGENAGTYAINVSASDTANYKVTAVPGTFTISPKDLSITANSDTFTYDGTEKTVSGFTYSGLLDGQEITGISASRTEKNAGAYPVEISGTPVIMDGTENVSENYTITTVPGSLIINTASLNLTVKANSATDYTYDGSDKSVSGYTVEGLLTGHELSGISASRTEKNAGTYPVEVTGTPKIMDGDVDVTKNYSVNIVPGSLVIRQKAVYLTAGNAEKIYGEDDPALPVNVEGVVDGESIDYTVSREPGENAGEYDIIISVSDTLNYAVSATNGTFTIHQKALSVTANSDTFPYDGSEKTVSGYTFDGLLAGQEITGLTASASAKNVGTYPVKFSGETVIMDGDVNVTKNYDITLHDGSLVISKVSIPLSITAKSGTFTYDGTEKTVSGYTYTGLLDGQEITGVSASASAKNVGAYKVELIGTPKIMDGGVDVTENYDISTADGSLVIDRASIALTLTGNSGTFPYDGTDKTVAGFTYSGLLAGQELSGLSASTTAKNVGTYPVEVTGTPKIMDGDVDVTENYVISRVDGSLVIEAASIPLSITANSDTFPYDGSEKTVSGYTFDGLLAGQEITGLTASRTEKNAGTYPVEFSGEPVILDGGVNVTKNYDITLHDGSLVISKASIPLSITANSDTFPYDGSEKTVSGYTFDGLLAGQEITGVSASASAKNVGTYPVEVTGTPKIMDGDVDVSENYVITLNDGSLVISKASIPLSITANSDTFPYDGSEKTVSGYTFDGLLDGQEITGVSASASAKNVGSYKVKVSGTPKIMDGDVDVSENYVITLNDGSLVISKASIALTLTGNSGTFTYDGTEKTVAGFTYSGLLAGQELSGLSASTTAKNVGTYPVEVTGTPKIMDGDVDVTENYVISRVDGSLIIEAASIPLTITANSDTFTYDGSEKTVSGYTVNGLLDGHELSGVSASAAATDGGTYPVEVTGTPKIMDGDVDVSENYVADTVPGNLVILQKEVAITAADAEKTYGDTDPALTANVSGLVDGESIPYTVSRAAGENAGVYDINVTAADTRNYKVSVAAGTFTIHQKALSVTANSNTFTYDGSEKTVSGYTFDGLLDGQEISGLTASASAKNVGTYPVKVTGTPKIMDGGADATGNYDITLHDGSLVISKASIPLSITANSDTFTYDGTEKTVSGFLHSGLLDGHTLSGVSASATGRNGGTYPVEVTGTPKIMDGETDVTENYVITTQNGSMVIGQRDVTIIAADAEKTYGDTDPALTANVSGAVDGDSVSYLLSRTGGENAGEYDITVTATDTSNYKFTVVGGTFTINQKAMTVTVNEAAKVYGDEEPAYGISLSDALVGDDTLLTTFSRVSGENVGEYEVSVVLGQNGNYDLTVIPGTLTITPKDAVITVDDQTKVAGSAEPVYTASVDGLVNDDTLEYTFSRAPGEAVGEYAITAEYTPNDNYNVTVVDGVLRITAAPAVTTRPSTPTTDPTPTTTPEPTPLTAPPTTTAPVPAPVTTPAAPVTTPTVSIDEPDVPAASLPVTSNAIIDEPDVPLAAAPTPVWALVNLLLTIATALIMLLLLIFYFIGKKNKEDEEDEENPKLNTDGDPKQNHVLKRKGFWRLLSIIPGLGSVIAFILTENMRNPMVLVDKWTLLMALIALVQIVITILSIKGRKDKDMEEEDEENA